MFDFRGRDVGEDSTEKYNQWLEECLDCEVMVLGGGVTALVAGIELQDRGQNVLLLTEADQPGGRLVWENGPVEILSPADELLEELGFPIDSNLPLWVDRLELLGYLVNRFYELGGLIINSAVIENYFQSGQDGFEVEMLLNDRPLIASSPELIVTTGRDRAAGEDSYCPGILEKIVHNTRRTGDGFVAAGLNAHSPGRRGRFCPLVNGFILSGRKAARLSLAD